MNYHSHPRSSFVYCIGADDMSAVKVGRTDGPAERLPTIQVGNPSLLKYLGLCRVIDPIAVERRLHTQFAHLLIRAEWFDNTSSEVTNAFLRIAGGQCCLSDAPQSNADDRLKPRTAFDAYIKENFRTQIEAAAALGVPYSSIGQWAKGVKVPPAAHKRQIAVVTDGRISVDDWRLVETPINFFTGKPCTLAREATA